MAQLLLGWPGPLDFPVVTPLFVNDKGNPVYRERDTCFPVSIQLEYDTELFFISTVISIFFSTRQLRQLRKSRLFADRNLEVIGDNTKGLKDLTKRTQNYLSKIGDNS